jgi:hypothetical protein
MVLLNKGPLEPFYCLVGSMPKNLARVIAAVHIAGTFFGLLSTLDEYLLA